MTPSSQGKEQSPIPGRFIPGGVALWGAVDPVFNTGPDPRDWGVHVHARLHEGGHKAIDQTFGRVHIVRAGDGVLIDSGAATAFVAAAVFDLELKILRCPHCGGVHLDADEFAVFAHRKHQCNDCGRHFFDPDGEASISNPLAGVSTDLDAPAHSIVSSRQALSLEQVDATGGLAIWGSNPAVLWTATRPEEAGIHVHGWSQAGKLFIDDTFGSVTIDGVKLDPDQVRVLMVQRSLPFLRDRVADLSCTACGAPHFDRSIDALRPHADHLCDTCGEVFTGRSRYRRVVSNPSLGVFRRLSSGQ